MRTRLTTIALVAVVALFIQGCNLSPTAPRRSAAPPEGLEQASGEKKGGGAGTTGIFDVTVTGDVTGAGTGFQVGIFNNEEQLVIGRNNNPGNVLTLDLGALDTSSCYIAGSESSPHFKILQPDPRKSPEVAETRYYFDAEEAPGVTDRFLITIDGSFDAGTASFWVSQMAVGDTNHVNGSGAGWRVTKSEGKGSKNPCASGSLSYSITVSRTG